MALTPVEALGQFAFDWEVVYQTNLLEKDIDRTLHRHGPDYLLEDKPVEIELNDPVRMAVRVEISRRYRTAGWCVNFKSAGIIVLSV